MAGFPKFWARIAKLGELPADVTPHTLRHSYASVAGDLGYSEPTIAALIGHKGHTITSRYVHTADAVLRRKGLIVGGGLTLSRTRQRNGQLVLIVGEPGLGKSRLIVAGHKRESLKGAIAFGAVSVGWIAAVLAALTFSSTIGTTKSRWARLNAFRMPAAPYCGSRSDHLDSPPAAAVLRSAFQLPASRRIN